MHITVAYDYKCKPCAGGCVDMGNAYGVPSSGPIVIQILLFTFMQFYIVASYILVSYVTCSYIHSMLYLLILYVSI